MRKLLRGVLIGLLTFYFGVRVAEIANASAIDPPAAYRIFVAPKGPRFWPTGRGCGNGGYVQGYVTDDDQIVSEGVINFGSRRKARKAFNEWKGEATRILEYSQRYRDSEGVLGERVMFEYYNHVVNKNRAVILFYDGGETYRYFAAPTADLALELEQYMISIDNRSPV